MQVTSSLPLDLRILAAHLRRCAGSDLGMGPQECARVAVLLHQGARDADKLIEQATLSTELEDELHAVAFDFDRLAPAPVEGGYQAALKAQQYEIQRQLDGGGAVHVSRPGLAALAMPIGDTNVLVMPIAPRPRPYGGDDGLDGGDAA